MEIERAGLARYGRVVKSLSNLLKNYTRNYARNPKATDVKSAKLFWLMKRLEPKIGQKGLRKADKSVVWKAVIKDKKDLTDAVRKFKK